MQASKKLPEINYPLGKNTIALNERLKRTQIALSFLINNIEEIKKQAYSERVKRYEIEIKRLNDIIHDLSSALESYKEKLKEIDTSQIKEYKATIEKLNKKLVESENSVKAYKKDSDSYYNLSKKLTKINKKVEQENRELKVLVRGMEKKIKGVKAHYNREIGILKTKQEEELSSVIKGFMEKELMYTTKIDSLKSDLTRYYEKIKRDKLKKDSMINDVKSAFDKSLKIIEKE